MAEDLLSWPRCSARDYSTSLLVPWFTPSRPSVREPSLIGQYPWTPSPGSSWRRSFSILHCPSPFSISSHFSRPGPGNLRCRHRISIHCPLSIGGVPPFFSHVFQACCCGVSPEVLHCRLSIAEISHYPVT
jgi:hypothetical protein